MRFLFWISLLGAASLSACAGLTGPVIMGGDAAGIYLTKPDKPPPADTADQIPAHQSWCYRTSGYAQCYAHPQPSMAERLINVDPQSAYPLDPDAYRQAVANDKKPVAPPAIAYMPPVRPDAAIPAAAGPPPDVQLEKASLKDEIGVSDPPPSEAVAMPQPIIPPPVQQEQ